MSWCWDRFWNTLKRQSSSFQSFRNGLLGLRLYQGLFMLSAFYRKFCGYSKHVKIFQKVGFSDKYLIFECSSQWKRFRVALWLTFGNSVSIVASELHFDQHLQTVFRLFFPLYFSSVYADVSVSWKVPQRDFSF